MSIADKGSGLRALLEEMGIPPRLSIVGSEVVYVYSDSFAAQRVIEKYSLDDAKAYACAQVDKLARTKFNKATEGISPAEMIKWPELERQARKFAETNDANDCPDIYKESHYRQCSVANLVTRVLNNAEAFNLLRVQIAGISGMHRDTINALDSFEAINAYDYTTGWPL